jgi:hypothetical protein
MNDCTACAFLPLRKQSKPSREKQRAFAAVES